LLLLQYVCSPEQVKAKECFSNVDMYQLFDLTKVGFSSLSRMNVV
jgi:hypothetical protein